MSSRRAFLALLAAWFAFFAPLLLRNEVVFPHDNRAELGVVESRRSTFFDEPLLGRFLPWVARDELRLSTRRTSDVSSVYVPELHHELHGDASSWISLWNPHVQMGRPTSHVSGLSPAYLPTRALAWLTDDALRLFTWIVLFHSLLTACAAFAFLGELGLSPWARFAGGAFASLAFFPVFWLVQPMFGAGVAWTLVVFWAGTRFLRAPSASAALVTAFGAWCLLLAGYPQQIVWHAWLGLAWFGSVWWAEVERAQKLRRALGLALAFVVGALAALPVYLDVATQAANSMRGEVDETFLLQSVVTAATWKEAASLIAVHFDPFWIDTPMQEEYPERLFGFAFSAPLAALCVVAALRGARSSSAWRRAWPWLGCVVVALVVNAWPGAYLFGVRHLGLSLSRFAPLIACAIPVPVLAALAIERVLASDLARPARTAFWSSLPFLVALSAGAYGMPWMKPAFVLAALALHGLTLAFVLSRRAWLVPVLVAATVLHYGQRVVLAQRPAAIARTSPLVEALRERSGDRARFCIAGFERWGLLPPNQEAWIGLSSPHSYDSLSSLRFNTWLREISLAGARARGRSFRRIEPADGFFGDAFTWMGVGAVLATRPIESPHLADELRVGGVSVWRTREPAERIAQLDVDPRAQPGSSAAEPFLEGPLSAQPHLALRILEEHDDRVRCASEARDTPTLLFLSRQHHEDWIARSGGARLATTRVNGFYLGVVLPPHTREVELSFEPCVRSAWVPQAAFAVAGLGVLLAWLLRRRANAAAIAR